MPGGNSADSLPPLKLQSETTKGLCEIVSQSHAKILLPTLMRKSYETDAQYFNTEWSKNFPHFLTLHT